jgi:hypothetical protein
MCRRQRLPDLWVSEYVVSGFSRTVKRAELPLCLCGLAQVVGGRYSPIATMREAAHSFMMSMNLPN